MVVTDILGDGTAIPTNFIRLAQRYATIHWFGYVVAATLLVIGLFDYWFGDHHLTAFLSWAVLAAIPWLVGRASLYVMARR